MQDKKEKQRSQLPVAAVYTVALLIGVLVFGLIGFLAVRNFLPSDNSSSEVLEEDRHNYSSSDDSITLYAVTDDFDSIKSVVLSAFKPSTQNIIIIPLTPYLDCNGQTFEEIYKTHGIADATESASAKLGVEIDKYMTLSEDTLSEVINIMGTSIVSLVDPIVIPDRATGGTVSYQKGARIAVDGDMAVTLIGYPTYASGFGSNMKMSGEIAANAINTFFKQPATAKLNIDLIFNKEYGDANTNMTQDDYNLMKSAIVYVIENSTMPSYSLTPTGEWPEPTRFIIDQSFTDQLDGYLVG